MTLEELKRTNRLLKEALHLEQEHLQAAQQRIKRLEEAGDKMMSEPCEYTFEQWIKAKENK